MLLLADKPGMTTWRSWRGGVQTTATVCLVASCGELRVSKLSMSLVSVAYVCARHYLLLCSSPQGYMLPDGIVEGRLHRPQS